MSASSPHYFLFSESTTDQQPSHCGVSGGDVGRWRFVLEKVDGTVRFEAADEESSIDDSRLELLAVVRGLEALDEPSRVTLVTPSRYVTRGLRYRLDQWRENSWCWERFGEMTPVRNRDLWQRVDRAMKYHRIDCRVWRFDFQDSHTPKPRSAAVARARKKRSGDSRRRYGIRILSLLARMLRTGIQRGWALLPPLRAPCQFGLGTE
jgi:ribonuclease HI